MKTKLSLESASIIIFFLLFVGLSFAGLGPIVRLVFPVFAVGLALFLYRRESCEYVSFVWWLWLLTPFVRRVGDQYSGWDASSFILVAPYLVTLIPIQNLYHYLPKAHRTLHFPFVLGLLGIIYGILLGLINYPISVVLRTTLNWLTPIIFGLHLAQTWKQYPEHYRAWRSTVFWGTLILATYGLYQFFVAPDWDMSWLINSELTSSAGAPAPREFRLWSTTNSPGHFALWLVSALIFLTQEASPIGVCISIAGYLCLLLTTMRSAWFAWVIAIACVLPFLKARVQVRMSILFVVLLASVFLLSGLDPFSEIISSRFESFTNLSDDVSLHSRQANYNANFEKALYGFVGFGIGRNVDNIDSGVLDMMTSLGWIGSIPYLSGILLSLKIMFRREQKAASHQTIYFRACALSTLSLCLFFSAFGAFFGLFLWGFIGFSMAEKNYSRHYSDHEIAQKQRPLPQHGKLCA